MREPLQDDNYFSVVMLFVHVSFSSVSATNAILSFAILSMSAAVGNAGLSITVCRFVAVVRNSAIWDFNTLAFNLLSSLEAGHSRQRLGPREAFDESVDRSGRRSLFRCGLLGQSLRA